MKSLYLLTTCALCFIQLSLAQQMHHVTLTINQPAQLVASAGPDVNDASTLDIVLGGSPTANGGTSPYTYAWSPATNVSDPLGANPELDLITAADTYTVTVTDANGCTSVDEMEVLVSIVSVEEKNHAIVVYPNPASKQITIEVNENADRILVYDTSGRLIKEERPTSLKHELNLSALDAGFYLLKVKQGRKLHVVKLLIH
jgi:hypothetical protein